MIDFENLIERLRSIAGHDWRQSHLAHTSDTAWEAAKVLADILSAAGGANEWINAAEASINSLTARAEKAEKERDEARAQWRCFHCEEVFTSKRCAEAHFGRTEDSQPACIIKAGAEGSLVEALRRAEEDAAQAWSAIASETTDAAKAYYAQQSRHSQQLRLAEEAGYERGLHDASHEAMRAEAAAAALAALTAENARLRAALEPFSEFAGQLFARNYNRGDKVATVVGWSVEGYPVEVSIEAGAFFAARRALGGDDER